MALGENLILAALGCVDNIRASGLILKLYSN